MNICQGPGCQEILSKQKPGRNRKYHSYECRVAAGNEKQKEARRQVRQKCVCENCGKLIADTGIKRRYCDTFDCNDDRKNQENQKVTERRIARGCIKCRTPGGPWKRGICPDCWQPPKRRPSSVVRGYGPEYRRNRATLKLLTQESNDCCWRCFKPFRDDFSDFTADHVEFKRQGGSDALSNLKPAHKSCNSARQPEGKIPWETLKRRCLWCGREFEQTRRVGSDQVEDFCPRPKNPPPGRFLCPGRVAYASWQKNGPLFKKIPLGHPANPRLPAKTYQPTSGLVAEFTCKHCKATWEGIRPIGRTPSVCEECKRKQRREGNRKAKKRRRVRNAAKRWNMTEEEWSNLSHSEKSNAYRH